MPFRLAPIVSRGKATRAHGVDPRLALTLMSLAQAPCRRIDRVADGVA
jgi:hypothetical protein